LSTHTITILDNELEPDFGSCSNLFFSEYIEGSSNNKVLEIYNPTCDTVDLANYQIQRFTNGSASASGTYTFPTGTLLASQEVYVIANASSDPTILSVADTTNAATFFNGDDAVTLMDLSTGDTLDIIGVVGVDPGTGWTVGSGATANYTLVRKPNIHDGTTDWSVSSTQWEVLTIDTFDSLGMHWATTCNEPVVAAFTVQDTVSCLGSTVCFTNTTTGGSCNMTYIYDLGDGIQSAQEDFCHIYTAPGTYTVTLIVDDNGTTYTSSVAITVLASSDATITAAGPFCETDPVINLTASDAGGTWSGIGITDANAGTFDPSTTGAGTFDIVYTISGTCGDADTLSIAVMASETADIVYSDTVYCANLEASITPTNNGDAGTFSGSTGLVIDANTGVIDGTSTIAGSGAGSYTVTYITNGVCADTLEVDIYLENCDALEEASSFGLEIYPNPVKDQIMIKGNLGDVQAIKIFDLAGKVVYEFNSNFMQIDVSNLAKGSYFLLVELKNDLVQHRFLKE
jgi:PKD repeat protein